MWKLKELVDQKAGVSTQINGEWVPVRPLNGKKEYMSLRDRIHDAWEVFMCRAEAFKWPGGQ